MGRRLSHNALVAAVILQASTRRGSPAYVTGEVLSDGSIKWRGGYGLAAPVKGYINISPDDWDDTDNHKPTGQRTVNHAE